MRIHAFQILLTALFATSAAYAAPGAIRIEGRASATVARPVLTLADVADVYSPDSQDDDAVIALRSIRLGSAPEAGKIIELTAEQLIERMRVARVNLERVGYRLPARMTVQRAARQLSEAELRASIDEYFRAHAREVEVQAVQIREPILVEPGQITLEAQPVSDRGMSRSGRQSFDVTARGEFESKTARIVAAIEEWKNVPVATRTLTRGMTIDADDIVMARMKAHKLPNGVVDSLGSLLGYALGQNVTAGQPFDSSVISLPIVVSAGSRVTMVVRDGGLEATASGVAIEAGALNQRISVRNEQSKRLVTGRIIEPGLVLIEEGAGT